MLERILKNVFHLTDNEVATYVCLVNLGPQPASIIAKKVGCARSSIYFTLERLIEKGMVYAVMKSNIRCFSAVDFYHLQCKLQRKKRDHIEHASNLETSIEELNTYKRENATQSETLKEQTHVQMFNDHEGIITIWTILLESPTNLMGFGDFGSIKASMLLDEPLYNLCENARKKIDIMITAEERQSSRRLEHIPNVSVRYFDPRYKSESPTRILCTDEYVAFYSKSQKGIHSGILIKDHEMAQKQKELLLTMWSTLK